MNKKIITFGASNSKKSINKQFASFTAHRIENADVTLLDLNDFEMPIYSIDRESETGVPELAHQFKQQLSESDGIIISFAEHNGVYSTAFKNIFDWISRIDDNVWENKPMFLLATSPGPRGGQTALDIAVAKFTRMTDKSVVHFSLPSFMENFSEEIGIINNELLKEFNIQLASFSDSL